MSEEEKLNPEPLGDEGTTSVVYATPLKRIWAWVGVVYMVILVLLVTYGMACGRYLTGIGGLMILPALGGAAASALWLWNSRKEQRTPPRAALLGLLLLLCCALAVSGIMTGIPGLLANFGG